MNTAPDPAAQLTPAKLWLARLLSLAVLVGIVLLVIWEHPRPQMLAAGLVWAGYLIYWSLPRSRSGGAARTEDPRSRRFHQRLLNAGLLLLLVPLPGLGWTLIADGMNSAVGLGLMALGTGLHIWARRALGQQWTGEVQIRADHQLVQSGPYARVRHPIYTALLIVAFGTAVVAGRLTSFVGFAVFAGAYLRKLRLEERGLHEHFGAAWDTYARRTWALLPPLY